MLCRGHREGPPGKFSWEEAGKRKLEGGGAECAGSLTLSRGVCVVPVERIADRVLGGGCLVPGRGIQWQCSGRNVKICLGVII